MAKETEDIFRQKQLDPPPKPEINLQPTNEGTVMNRGSMRSPNYRRRRAGWSIDTDGNAEFQDGTFNGTFSIGGTTITIDNNDDIQEAVDFISQEGGGTVWLQPGTYILTADLLIPSGVKVFGVNRDTTIIDCDGSWAVKMIGSDAYSTGTITIANGSTALAGSGTSWNATMEGQLILLDGLWYEIEDVLSSTSITLSTPFTGDDQSGGIYTIATINVNPTISKVTITGATGSGLVLQYVMEPNIDDVYVTECGIGIDMDQVVYPLVICSSLGNGVNLDMYQTYGFEIRFSAFDDSTVGDGIEMELCGDATFFDSGAGGNAGNGLNMVSCKDIAFMSCSFSTNGENGVEFVSGCEDISFFAATARNNVENGYKFTATALRNEVNGTSIFGNGELGVTVVDDTSENNTIIGCFFDDNMGGDIYNAGTETLISSNNYAKTNATIEYLQAAKDATDGTSFTYAGQSLGAADDDRYIIVAISGRALAVSPTILSVTIAGIAASIVIQDNDTIGLNVAAIAIAHVPTGTSGSVVVVYDNTMTSSDIFMHRALNLTSIIPTDTGSSDADPATASIDVVAGGIAVGHGKNDDATSTASWTGLTEKYDEQGANTDDVSGASGQFADEQTLAVDLSWSGSAVRPIAVFASFPGSASIVDEGDRTKLIPTTVYGSGAPAVIPTFKGDFYVDTTGLKLYVATGSSTTSDWTILN